MTYQCATVLLSSAIFIKLSLNFHRIALAVVAVSGLHIQSLQGLHDQVKFGFKGSDSMDQNEFDLLLKSVPGTPGKDYPIFAEVPETKFDCKGLVDGGERF